MGSTRIFAGLMVLSICSACGSLSGVPSAKPFPDATLLKAKSAQHWDVIAGDVAAQTALAKDRVNLASRPLHVVAPAERSDFGRAFQTMLVSQLVNAGMNVATKPEGAIEVRYETQVVRHRSGSGNYQPGTLAALAGGIVVVRELAESDLSRSQATLGVAAVLAGADLATAYARLRSPTNTEVVITTSLIDRDRYLMRKTDVYYVEDAEGAMFEAPYRAQTKTIEVTGK